MEKDKVRISARIDKELHDRIEKLAKDSDRSFSWTLQDLAKLGLEVKQNKKHE